MGRFTTPGKKIAIWYLTMTSSLKESLSVKRQEDKYTRKAILIPSKIRKGKTRWNQCADELGKINSDLLQGPVLDFGCGGGYFVLEGLRRDVDIWGVDQLFGKIKRYRKLIEYTSSPKDWEQRCLVADGVILPFRSDCFDLVSSWWVFEHIPVPGEAIREMVRVTRPGGVIVIRAQDARTSWEGHCNIPWIPYLSDRLTRVWIEEFGKSPSMYEGVYDVTQPQVISILESLGCRVIFKSEAPQPLIGGHRQLCTEKNVRQIAQQIKAKLDRGDWIPRQDGLYIYARKV